MGVPFKNYELIMAMVLIIAVIFMITAFIKLNVEHEESKDDDAR